MVGSFLVGGKEGGSVVGCRYESAFAEIRYISMTTKKKILIGVVIAVAAAAIIRVLVTVGLIGLMLFGSFTSKPEVYDEIENYAEYMSFSYENADTLWRKKIMNE